MGQTAHGDLRMDIVGGRADGEGDREGVGSEVVSVGTDERRMHVRAYNYWVSLLQGRPCPLIESLDPAGIADFGPNSVLLDFTGGDDDAEIRFLGHALREESGTDSSITRLSQVPSRSLLSRLTDHYLQIIANRAPIGFEAEFVGHRGFPMLYRGILMPFSSDGEAIDYLYGVINWKEVVDADLQSQLAAELTEARRVTAPRRAAPVATATAWADGPSAPIAATPAPPTLAEQLVATRKTIEAAPASPDAVARAYDFLIASERDAAGYAAMLAGAGLTVDPRAPVETLVKLVFGAPHEGHARLLARAHRAGVGMGEFAEWVERTGARPAAAAKVVVPISAGNEPYVLLLARAVDQGSVEILGRVAADAAVIEAGLRELGY